MRKSLTREQLLAARNIRAQFHHSSYSKEDIRPLPQEGAMVSMTRAQGACLWAQRESFVVFFSGQDEQFNEDLFRESCTLPKVVPARLDADRTAKPLNKLVRDVVPGDCVLPWPHALLTNEGEKIPLAASSR